MKNESGNALIYVLIAIVLFAALSFTLGRQTDSGEADILPREKANLYAVQLMSYSAQVKSVVDQMLFSGTNVDDLSYILPSDSAFEDVPPAAGAVSNIYKIYHPAGGGLIPSSIPDEAQGTAASTPASGFYLGQFTHIEWTASTADEIILTAYNINQSVCEEINETVTGSTDIPTTTQPLTVLLLDDTLGVWTNIDMTTESGTPHCPECHEMTSLCVQNGGIYAFYSIVFDQ